MFISEQYIVTFLTPFLSIHTYFRGDQIINLELVDIDEVNLNAILLIGEQCLNLQKLCLHGCHFQIQPEDVGTVDSLCRAKSVCGEPGNNFCL